jgi:hypothetical protein
MRSQYVNWFFLALSIADIALLSASFIIIALPVIAESSDHFMLIDMSNRLIGFTYPYALIAQTCSVYLTVFASVHRWLGVCHPFLVFIYLFIINH